MGGLSFVLYHGLSVAGCPWKPPLKRTNLGHKLLKPLCLNTLFYASIVNWRKWRFHVNVTNTVKYKIHNDITHNIYFIRLSYHESVTCEILHADGRWKILREVFLQRTARITKLRGGEAGVICSSHTFSSQNQSEKQWNRNVAVMVKIYTWFKGKMRTQNGSELQFFIFPVEEKEDRRRDRKLG